MFRKNLLPSISVPKVEQRGTFHHIPVSCRLTRCPAYPEPPIFKENVVRKKEESSLRMGNYGVGIETSSGREGADVDLLLLLLLL
jgi:hypothetical protein